MKTLTRRMLQIARVGICVSVIYAAYGCHDYIQPAYFNRIDVADACGKATTKCQPQGMHDYYLLPDNPIPAPAKPSDYIGKKFNGKLTDGLAACYEATEGVHFTKTTNQIVGEMSSRKLEELKLGIKADFAAAAKGATDPGMANAISAKLEYALNSIKSAKGKINITMYNKPLTLNLAPGVRECIEGLQAGEQLVVGMTVVEVPEVEWGVDITKQIEASVGADASSAKATAALGFSFASFVNQKLTGRMTGFSTVWSIGYQSGGYLPKPKACPNTCTGKCTVDGRCEAVVWPLRDHPAQQMPDRPAEFNFSNIDVAALAPGAAQAAFSGTLHVWAGAPTWKNSPYQFKVSLLVDGQDVWTQSFSGGNDESRSTEIEMPFSDSANINVKDDGRPSVRFSVTPVTNWTYRSGQFGNEPDRAVIKAEFRIKHL
jgi:hypothetical protein